MKRLTKRTLHYYWQVVKKYKGWFLLSVITIIIGDIFATATPYLYKILFDRVVEGVEFSGILPILFFVGGSSLLHWVFIQIAEVSFSRAITKSTKYLRNFTFDYIHRHSFQFFQDHFVGSLVKKVNRFTRIFDGITGKFLWEMFPLALNALFIIAILYTRHWVLAAGLVVWATIYCLASYAFSRYKLKYDVKRAESETKMTGQLADTITNNNTVKLFAALGREKASYEALTEKHRQIGLKSWDLGTISGAVQWFSMIILELGLMYAALHLYGQGALTVGDFVLIQAYLLTMFEKLYRFGRMIRELYEQFADAEEMTVILEQGHDVVDSKSAKKLTVPKGEITFDNVSFYYHKTRKILKKLSLTIKAGEKVALVGPSGAGKSTIVKLLLRSYDVSRGKVLIDGQRIRSVTQDSLHEAVALVPQDPILFHRTLKENIRYARPDATDEDVFAAAKAARCHDFILELPEQYETLVGERGVKLSGGERQRVAIARAILKDAPILVLDEATSSLDSESEVLIQEALEHLMKGKTVITIAHRLSTIMNMDRIIVLKEGEILEQGSHKQLKRKKTGLYRQLWDHQAGGFIS